MTVAAMCNDCFNGPQGIDGHENLVMATDGANTVAIFHCQACHALWSRDYEGSGRFGWTSVAAPHVTAAAN